MWDRELPRKRAEELVDQMTVDERMWQLMYIAPARFKSCKGCYSGLYQES